MMQRKLMIHVPSVDMKEKKLHYIMRSFLNMKTQSTRTFHSIIHGLST